MQPASIDCPLFLGKGAFGSNGGQTLAGQTHVGVGVARGDEVCGARARTATVPRPGATSRVKGTVVRPPGAASPHHGRVAPGQHRHRGAGRGARATERSLAGLPARMHTQVGTVAAEFREEALAITRPRLPCTDPECCCAGLERCALASMCGARARRARSRVTRTRACAPLTVRPTATLSRTPQWCRDAHAHIALFLCAAGILSRALLKEGNRIEDVHEKLETKNFKQQEPVKPYKPIIQLKLKQVAAQRGAAEVLHTPMCVHTYMYTYMFVCIHVYVCSHIYVCVFVCVCVCSCMNVHIYIHTSIHRMHITHTHTHTHISVLRHMHRPWSCAKRAGQTSPRQKTHQPKTRNGPGQGRLGRRWWGRLRRRMCPRRSLKLVRHRQTVCRVCGVFAPKCTQEF